MTYQQLLYAYNGSWGDGESLRVQGHLNSPGAVEALEFLKELLTFSPGGGTHLSYERVIWNFNQGRTGMCVNYFTFFPGLLQKQDNKVGFFKIPRKGDRRVASLGGQGFSISTKIPEKRQELAKKFIAWFLETRNQEKWIAKPAGLPPRQDAIHDMPIQPTPWKYLPLATIGPCFSSNRKVLVSARFLEAAPYNRAFAESVDHLQDFWNLPEYSELLWASQQHLSEALDGVKTPREALDQLTAEHERIFRRADKLTE